MAAGQKCFGHRGNAIDFADGKQLTIKKVKYGEESHGMICAEMNWYWDVPRGIMVLPEDTPVGIPAATFEPSFIRCF